jgi:hypothetical protein
MPTMMMASLPAIQKDSASNRADDFLYITRGNRVRSFNAPRNERVNPTRLPPRDLARVPSDAQQSHHRRSQQASAAYQMVLIDYINPAR